MSTDKPGRLKLSAVIAADAFETADIQKANNFPRLRVIESEMVGDKLQGTTLNGYETVYLLYPQGMPIPYGDLREGRGARLAKPKRDVRV